MTQTLGLIAADFETSLATKMAIDDTTATLLSATDDDGVTLATGKYYLTIDGNNSSKEHIYCTLTGTSLTNIQNVTRQGVVTDGCLKAHRIGAKVTLTDFANLRFISKQLDGSMGINATVGPLIYDAQPTITDDKHLATKKYIDDTAIAGSPKATDAVYGIAKLSVAAASAVEPIVVGDNDGRIPTQDENNALAGTSGSPSSSNKFVTAEDVTEAKTASKIPRRDANSDILVATTPTAGDAACSKTYTDKMTIRRKQGVLSKSNQAGSVSTLNCGFRPKIVRVYAHAGAGSGGYQSDSQGSWNVTDGNMSSFYTTNGSGTSSTYVFNVNTINNAYYVRGLVENITASGFDLNMSVDGSNTFTAQIMWEAEGQE